MKKRLLVGSLAGLLLAILVTPVNGQTFSAELQNFWNQLRTGALVFTNLKAVNATITGTCTGCGGGGGGTIGGSIANTQVAVGSGVNTVAGSANLTWDGSVLNLGGLAPGDLNGWGTISSTLSTQRTITDFTNLTSSLFVSDLLNPAGDTASDTFTGFFDTEIAAGNTHAFGTINGLQAYFDHLGTGTVTEYVGLQVLAGNRSSATIQAFTGVEGSVANWSTGTVTIQQGLHAFGTLNYGAGHVVTGAGVFVNSGSNSGTVDNNYGVYVDDQTMTTTNGSYAFYYKAPSSKTFSVRADGQVQIDGQVLTLANSFTTSGNFAVTQTYTGTTNVTFPTSGTLSTTTGANPTASVGLSAVNGSAATFLRSDGSPALSQAITPTWTGLHIFTPPNNSAAITLSANTTGVGTIATASNTVVTGTSTKFMSQFAAGDTITPSGQTAKVVSYVATDTSLVLTTNASATASGISYTITPIDHSVNPNGSFSSSPFSIGSGNPSDRYGQGAVASGANSFAAGRLASATGPSSTAVGDGATSNQSNGVAIGSSATVTGNGNGIAIGQGSSAAGGISIGTSATTNDTGNATSVCIGFSCTTSAHQSIAIGRAPTVAAISADGQLVIGSDATSAARITDGWIGGGRLSATPTGFTLHGTGGSGSNIAASDVRIAAGISTGMAAGGNVGFQTAPTLQASGSTANTLIDREIYSAPGKPVTSGVAVSLVDVALPTLKMAGGTLEYTIICSDGTDMQALSGTVVWSAVNKGGSYTTAITAPTGVTATDVTAAKSASGISTITLAWSMVTGTNKVTITATPTTSLTATTFQMYYVIRNHSQQAITPL